MAEHNEATYEDNLFAVADGQGATVAQVMGAVTGLVGRHEALRTLLRFDDDPRGTQRVTSVRAPDVEAAVRVESFREATDLFTRARHTSFDLATQWPFQAVVSTEGPRVREIGLVADHSAVDAWGLKVMRQDLEGLLRGTLPPLPTGGTDITQPLDVVRWEESESGQRHLERASRYWTRQFEELGSAAVSPAGVDGRRQAGPAASDRHSSCVLRSTSLLTAAEAASAALRVPVSTVLLTGFGLALCRWGGMRAVGVLTLTHNRWLGNVKACASKMFMQAPVVVDIPSPADLSRVARRTFVRQAQAGEFAHIDRAEADAIRDRVLPGADSIRAAGALFNFTDASLHAFTEREKGPLEASIARWPFPDEEIVVEEERRHGPQLMLTVLQEKHSIALRLAWCLDAELTRPGELFMRDIVDAVWTLAGGRRPRQLPRPGGSRASADATAPPS
ncbi:condensation domain-containing protein [Streptomyces sp. ME02-8801-2C]|uniref:condensation domain-containing protein n=1 Tax=Streptomyces sp. ME02-8801-2C TaxID=3028680 RepID=UPI0029A703D9|nr:condensation domain-containing protein [Streptomyces sp. ME02-8801-2C]MDX3457424.1 condensation domain-containing protein [Streptomyces sp. ME02-8801-2C]